MTNTSPDKNRVLLGQIGAAHGIRGDVKLRTYTEDPEAIATYGPLSDKSGHRTFEIKIVRITRQGVIAHIIGVDDRTSVEQLNGTELYVARNKLPNTDTAEFYHVDLIGLRASTTEGMFVGTVTAVHNFGAGDILEIVPASRADGQPASLLLPFTNAAVPHVDLDAGTLTIDPPELIEGDEKENGG